MAYLRLIPRLAPNKTQTLTLTQTLDLTQNLHLTLHPPLTPTLPLSGRLAFAVPPAQAFASNGGAACERHCLTTAAREGSVRPRSRNKSAPPQCRCPTIPLSFTGGITSMPSGTPVRMAMCRLNVG